NLPTGDYSAHLEDAKKKPYGNVTFRIDAYRIPTFEVELHAPDKVPLDGEFQVALTSTYYAGGKVAGRPVAWRVTQFPFTWSPKQREGFEYSSDVRFSGAKRFESSGKLEKDDTTDENGAAQLSLDPAVEPTAQPRTYVVEEKVSETTVTSGEEPTTLHLPLDHAGVYVVELEAHDRLGRAQVIGVDLYAGGAEPVTWAKPATRVFEVATDKEAYDPGETAALVLKSPFQDGRALAV